MHTKMLAPLDRSLSEYGISPRTGFLSHETPLRRLPDPYYEPWEAIGDVLPVLIRTARIRQQIVQLPVLSASKLKSELEWRRAFVLLSFIAQGYIWAGKSSAETLPPAVSCPLITVSTHLGLPPIATCAALNLWNFAPLSPTDDVSEPDNLVALQTFTGTEDESWFYVVSDAIEARGGRMIPVLLRAMKAAEEGGFSIVSEALLELADCFRELEVLLGRMHEKCNPDVFYNDIRPMLAGSKNMSAAGLPNGVFYDEGEGKGTWRQLSGASNAQSSLIPFFDIVLGVDHHATGQPFTTEESPFMKEMRNYMPKNHALFLGQLCPSTVRDFVMSQNVGHTIISHYNSAIAALASFRNKHIQIVTRYIILPSKANSSGTKKLSEQALNCHNGSKASESAQSTALLGTGGAVLVPFLKQARDETRAAVIGASHAKTRDQPMYTNFSLRR